MEVPPPDPEYGLWSSAQFPEHPGGTLGNSLWVCRPVLQILNLFQTKNVMFHTRFQIWPLRNNVIITWITAPTKTISKSQFRIGIFLFLFYSLGIETINVFIPSCSWSLENHTRIQTKMSKSLYPFSDQNGKNPTLWAAHTYTYMAYKRVYLPPPPQPYQGPNNSLLQKQWHSDGLGFSRHMKTKLEVSGCRLERCQISHSCEKKLEKINWLKGTRIVAASSKCFVSNCLLLWYRALITNRYCTMKFCNKHTH